MSVGKRKHPCPRAGHGIFLYKLHEIPTSPFLPEGTSPGRDHGRAGTHLGECQEGVNTKGRGRNKWKSKAQPRVISPRDWERLGRTCRERGDKTCWTEAEPGKVEKRCFPRCFFNHYLGFSSVSESVTKSLCNRNKSSEIPQAERVLPMVAGTEARPGLGSALISLCAFPSSQAKPRHPLQCRTTCSVLPRADPVQAQSSPVPGGVLAQLHT